MNTKVLKVADKSDNIVTVTVRPTTPIIQILNAMGMRIAKQYSSLIINNNSYSDGNIKECLDKENIKWDNSSINCYIN